VPRRKRAFAVTLTIVCIPLGGTLAALLSAQVLPMYGWRTLFVVGGIIPIVLAIVLFKVLPESPRYLASHPERWPELIAMLRRLGHNVPSDTSLIEAGTGKAVAKSPASIRDLFLRISGWTLGLFGAFFFVCWPITSDPLGSRHLSAGFQQRFPATPQPHELRRHRRRAHRRAHHPAPRLSNHHTHTVSRLGRGRDHRDGESRRIH
jgi:MFS family permease